MDGDNPGVQIIHRGKYGSLSGHEIVHTKADCHRDRRRLQGAMADAFHVLSCAADYRARWLFRAIARLGLGGFFYALSAVVARLA